MKDAASKVVGSVPQTLHSATVRSRTTWGRTNEVSWINSCAALLVLVAPFGLYINWLALEHYNGSLLLAFQALSSQGWRLMSEYRPKPTVAAFLGYFLWIAIQAALYHFLPGEQCSGARTPGGHRLQYTTNGLAAWTISHILYLAAAVLGVLDPALIARNWDG